MTDEEKIDLAKWVLEYHYGLWHYEEKRTTCCGCSPDTEWPCRPVRLAKAIQEEVLAR